jgi:hypothetical protein
MNGGASLEDMEEEREEEGGLGMLRRADGMGGSMSEKIPTRPGEWERGGR